MSNALPVIDPITLDGNPVNVKLASKYVKNAKLCFCGIGGAPHMFISITKKVALAQVSNPYLPLQLRVNAYGSVYIEPIGT